MSPEPSFWVCEGTLPQFHTHPSDAYEIEGFFLLYRGIFAKQKLKPLFFFEFRSLAATLRHDDGRDGVIFSSWAL